MISSYTGGPITAWSTAAHVNRPNIHVITTTWSVLHTVHCLTEIHHPSAQGQDREAQWTWCILCGAESWCQRCCKRTDNLPYNPGTLRSCCFEGLTPSCFLCHVWNSNHTESTLSSTTCRPFRTLSSLFHWCLCTTRPQTKYDNSNWPPSNIALTNPLCTTPAWHSGLRVSHNNKNDDCSGLYSSPVGILGKWTIQRRLNSHPVLEDSNLTEEQTRK